LFAHRRRPSIDLILIATNNPIDQSLAMATFSASALKVAAMCMVLLCVVGSDLARPALASSSSPDDLQESAGAGALLLRELLAHELAEELGLLDAGQQHGGDVGAVCTPACQNRLIVCAITCVLNANPAACFANCTVAAGCFSKALLVVA
jgi:hypothetical protein